MDGRTDDNVICMDKCTNVQTDRHTVRVDFKLICLSLQKKRGGWVAATPWLIRSALEIEVFFQIMKISHNPMEGGWGCLNKFVRTKMRPKGGCIKKLF